MLRIDRRTFNAGLVAVPLATVVPLSGAAVHRTLKPHFHWLLSEYYCLGLDPRTPPDLSDPVCIKNLEHIAKNLLRIEEPIFA
jgi:hypothetical protein